MPLCPFLIDCDTGRDDALALALAVQADAPLVAVVTSYGNVPLAAVTENTRRVLAWLGHGAIPVLPGAALPSQLEPVAAMLCRRQNTAGNGLCNLSLPAVTVALPPPLPIAALAQAVEEIAARHGPLDYVVLGPATNAAQLCAHWGGAASKYIAVVTMMGGKFDALWQENPVADFNIACDPFAVQALFESGLPLRFVPLNATWPIVLTEPELAALQPQTAQAAFFQQLMLAHARHFAPDQVFRFHDPTVILARKQPQHFAPVRLSIGTQPDTMDFARLQRHDNGAPAAIYHVTAPQQQALLQEQLRRLGF